MAGEGEGGGRSRDVHPLRAGPAAVQERSRPGVFQFADDVALLATTREGAEVASKE